MVLNPDYTDRHDWEVVSAGSEAEQSEEEDLVVDGYTDGDGEEEELRRRLLPPSSEAAYADDPSMVANEDEGLPEGLPPLTIGDGDGGEGAVREIADDSETGTGPNAENREPAISTLDLKDTVVVSREGEVAEGASSNEVAEDAGSSRGPTEQGKRTPKEGPESTSAGSNFERKGDGDAPLPQPKRAPKLAMAVKNLGDAIGKEGQKIGRTIEEETKRIGEATQRAFRPKPPREPSPSDHARRPRPEHTTTTPSPPRRERTTRAGVAAAREEPSNLLASVVSGASLLAGGILMARGNRLAGAALLATGGATYMANEAAKESRSQDIGLNEVLGAQMN